MKRLEEIKNEVAKDFGYESFEHFDDKSTFSYDHKTPQIIDAIATIYACEVAQASLQKAAEQAKTFKNSNGGSWLDASIKEESITNPNNITLL
ncbi:hypothetical protein M2T79_02500 [Elizabethkingia miricola]|uniref:hypothetical protein n=1 Tax=Elizabethkingia miricola TaxID=172045 RepID=UPI00201A0741|nr:hypothetical protein [Elizabethkingia miricola]MCL1655451.1 hypothetical protein [Elizabethkingia miricola]